MRGGSGDLDLDRSDTRNCTAAAFVTLLRTDKRSYDNTTKKPVAVITRFYDMREKVNIDRTQRTSPLSCYLS